MPIGVIQKTNISSILEKRKKIYFPKAFNDEPQISVSLTYQGLYNRTLVKKLMPDIFLRSSEIQDFEFKRL